ncbi:ATP-dependent translocase ABCB1-like isoform X2 [Cylas formicarius]|uniref:ATP-dependent translocase ABCB1-like isoform X2 n=1 Tax=Cylas formicarius TaxID=197179 RepID=UPI0029588EB1|nr:ATP-dependent translocase ABCB1-like isoform X2 [Cylas formicarius]
MARDKNETSKQQTKPNDEKTKDDMVPYYKLYTFATPLDKILILIGTLGSVVCGILQPYMMILFGDASGIMVNYFTSIEFNATDANRERAVEYLYDGILDFSIRTCAAALAIIVATYITGVAFSYSSLRQTFKMRKEFLEKTLNQDIGWYDQNQTGDFASVITDNIPKIEEGIGDKVGTCLFFFSTFASGLIWALIKGWKLALVCLAAFPIQLLVMGVISWLSAKYCKQEMQAYSGAGSVAEEVLSSIRTVVAFEGQERECKRYETYVKEAKDNNMKKCLFNAINQGFIWFLTYSCYALAFWYGIGLVIEERAIPIEQRVYTPGNMIGVFFATLIATWNFGNIAPFLEVFGMARGAAVKVFSILDSKPLIHKKENAGKKPNFKSDVVLRNVGFRYPSRSEIQVLRGVNLQIKFGETIALVGHSGSGKSTIIQLLQRFYDPSSGCILIDGVNLKQVNLSHLRKNVGVVSQEPSLFATTIAENIRYGKLNASTEEIVRAAKKANAHRFIQNLPNGYQTLIGERGAQLSGGQKQRIAIARALIKHPSLLLLDEATSALDTENEAEVQMALDSIDYTCTKIVVAHRLSTIRNADRIIVFDQGRVVEEGSHQQMMEAKGAYSKMINSQGYTELNREDDKINEVQTRKSSRVKSMTFSSHSGYGSDSDDADTEVVEEETEELSSFQVITKILKTNSREWLALSAGCLASVLNGASLPIYGLVFGDILGVLVVVDDELLRWQANQFCLYFLYLGIATGISMFLQFFAFGYAGEILTYRLRNWTFEAMLKQEMAWFDRKENGVGALCAQLSGDAASVQGAGGSRIGIIINSLSTLALSIIFGMYLEWRLTLVVLAFYPLILFSMYYERKSIQSDSTKTQKLLEKSAKVAVEAIENIKTVKSLGCEHIFCDAYNVELSICIKMGFKRCHLRGFIMGCARSLMFTYAAGLTYGSRLVVVAHVDSATIFKVLEVIISGSWSIGNALTFSSNMQKGLTAAARIFHLIKRIPEVRNEPEADKAEWDKGCVEFSKVHFSYPTRPSVQVLDGIDLSIMEGKTVALVGASGCGKSTIIQLLERFYDPTYGDVLVDRDDIKHVTLESLRFHLGIVSQEPNLFDRTIAENIGYGVRNRSVRKKEIELAAKAANIHNFVASLPLGYETRLGSKGTQLSGGQKQRIAIARALLRNPRILLLDEATSALDNESEKIVQEALDNARQGRTCITIAHRLTTIQAADLICVLKEGKIAETGTHTELLERKGLYFDYYKLQSGQG